MSRCSGGCGEMLHFDDLPAPDGPRMPHLIMCRPCANAALVQHGFAPLPDAVPAMLLPITRADWVREDGPAVEVMRLAESRACVFEAYGA
jgi:hypothetical protein